FFSSRRRHTRFSRDWSSDVCSSDLDGINISVNIAPKIPKGTESRIENGTDQLSYNAAKSKNTNRIHSAKICNVFDPDCFSCNDRSEERRVGKECRDRLSR